MTARFNPILPPFRLAVLAFVLLGACSAGSGTTGSNGNGGGTPPPPPSAFTVSGTVSNLAGTGLVLRNSVLNQPSDDLTVNANGSFTFGTAVADGATYLVSVVTQPVGQNCSVAQAAGIISRANVTDVAVSCTSVPTYSIGGRIEFLGAGKNIILQNNALDPLTVSANGTFVLATNQVANTAYNVTVASQPNGQNCVVINGTGVIGTANVTDVVVSCLAPRFAYVANYADNTISRYAIDVTSGQLRMRGYSPAGAQPIAAMTDSAGHNLYVANYGSDSVSSYAIDPATGDLTLTGTQTTAGLRPRSATIDPLGRYLYVIAGSGNSVSVYSINASNGTLGAPSSQPVSFGDEIVFDPTGTYGFLISSVTIGVTSSSITPYLVDPATGVLTQPVPFSSLAFGSAVSLAVNPSGRYLYVVNYNENKVHVYSIVAGTGALTEVGTPLATGRNPVNIGIDPHGRYLYIANYTSNDISAFRIDATTGALASAGPNVPVGTNPTAIRVDPSGQFVYVASNTSNSLLAYRINTGGVLTALTTAPKIASRRTPVSMAITQGTSPAAYTPKFAYVANNASNTVSAYTINSSGALAPLSSSGIPDIGTAASPESVAADPGGRFLYVANAGSGDLSAYSINAGTGALARIGGAVATGAAPRSLAIEPSGRFLYVANSGSNNVTVWAIDAQSGALSAAQTISAGTNPLSIAVDPTGQWAYVAAADSSSVLVYAIDPATGTLTAKATITDGNGPVSLTVDPTGNFVYVSELSRITTFAINPASGLLTAQGSAAGGATAPLIGTADPTGRYFYQASTSGIGIDVINVQNGALAPQASVAVAGATSVCAEPSGRFAYVAGSNGVTGFTINSGGTLSQIGSGAFAAGNSPFSVTVTGIWQ